MNTLRQIVLILLLAMSASAGLAQERQQPAATDTTATAAAATATTEAAPPTASADRERRHELRDAFITLLRQHPRQVRSVLALDPALLNNEQFVAAHPELVRFLAENPEIRRNPHYFVSAFQIEQEGSDASSVIEAMMMLGTITLFVLAFFWLVRTIVEQKRWNRLSRTQAEVHNKILDRFGSSEELLQYVRTPAGQKFLESAPIPLHVERAQSRPGPAGAGMLSIQIGVVLTAGALGLLMAASRFSQQTAQELSAMGIVAFAIGAGFVASALISIYLARKLGAWREPQGGEAGGAPHTIEDSGMVR